MISNKNRDRLIAILEHRDYADAGENFIMFPGDMNTISTIVRTSNRFGIRLAVIGGGSMLSKDPGDKKNTAVLSTQKLNGIYEIDRYNLFAEAGSGCRLYDLSEQLSKESLYFPIAFDEKTGKRTLGGIFSSLKPYSKALNYFSGIEFISPNGEIIKYGCKTLKNVSGYDIIRLMSGTFGKLGIVTSLLLRVFPEPVKSSLIENVSESSYLSTETAEDFFFDKLKDELDPNHIFI